MTQPVSARLPRGLVREIDKYADLIDEDRSTAMKYLMMISLGQMRESRHGDDVRLALDGLDSYYNGWNCYTDVSDECYVAKHDGMVGPHTNVDKIYIELRD
jgi:hypothetical protein